MPAGRSYAQTTNPVFDLVTIFDGYRNKTDITNIPEDTLDKNGRDVLVGTLVTGSQNVLMNDADRVQTRGGYALDGPATSASNVYDPIVSSYDWHTHVGVENHLRTHKGVMEWRYQDGNGNVSWLPLINTQLQGAFVPTQYSFNFAEYWNTTELIDELLMVNGDSTVYRWSGAQAILQSFTNAALTVAPAYGTHGTVLTVVGNSSLQTFSGVWSTAGNSVISGTINGQVVGFILCPNQPADGDTLQLTINGALITITFQQPALYTYTQVGSGKNITFVRSANYGAGRVRIGYNYSNGVNGYYNITSNNIPTTVANLLSLLSNPTNTGYDSFTPFDIGTSQFFSYMAFNGTPSFSGSTTTAGNTVSAAVGILTLAMVNNPANGDTLTINFNGQTIVFRFVNALAQAGDVIIGMNAQATLTNLTGLLNAPGTTNATQQAVSATNQLVLGCFSFSNSTGITLQGTNTWAQLGFYTSTTNRSVIINGVVFTYTGGESTLTITGVNPDPTAQGLAAGMPIVQGVINIPNSSITGIPATFGQNLIASMNNQIWYGSTTSRAVYMSKQNNFTDVSFSSPRLPGEGGVFYLDATPTGFGVLESNSKNQSQNDAMLVSAGTDFWYQFVFTLSTNLQNESVVVRRMETSAQSAAQTQGAIAKVKKNLVSLSFEPTLDYVANLEKIEGPKTLPISDPVKNDFNSYNFANVHALFFQSNVYVAVPKQSLLLIYNLAKGYWEAPQILPIQRLSIIGGLLYGHSNQVNETYRLFYGTNDNGNPINAIAAFSYHNYGMPTDKKNFTEVMVEGYISSNTTLATNILYDFGGATGIKTKNINGNGVYFSAGNVNVPLNRKTIFNPAVDPDLGKNQLGGQPIGTIPPLATTLAKFRIILTFSKLDFWECQIVFQSNDIDQQWELLKFGPAIVPSGADNNEIKV